MKRTLADLRLIFIHDADDVYLYTQCRGLGSGLNFRLRIQNITNTFLKAFYRNGIIDGSHVPIF